MPDGSPALGADGKPLGRVEASDVANAHVVAAPGVSIVKKINGDDANTAPGVVVAGGSAMTITFEVTNTGNVALGSVTVTDDKVTSGQITCPKDTLAVGETWTCTATLAAPGAGVQHTNTAIVVATPVSADGLPLRDLTTGQPLLTVMATDVANAVGATVPTPPTPVTPIDSGLPGSGVNRVLLFTGLSLLLAAVAASRRGSRKYRGAIW